MPAARLPRDLHPVAWWVWAIGLAAAASFTTNPFLLLLLVGVAAVVVMAAAVRPAVGAVVPALRLARRRDRGRPGGVPDPLRRRRRHRAARPARGPAARLGRGHPAARAGHPRGAARRPLRRAAARHARDLRRRGQLAGQPQAAAPLGAARALRDRHRAGRRGHRAAAARRQRAPGARGAEPARRGRPAGSAGCAGSWSRCSRTRWSARWRSPPAWTPAATAAPAGADAGPAAAYRRADAGRAVRHLRRRLRRARPDRAADAGRCRCWSLGVARRGRRAAPAPAAGCSAPATGPTGGAGPELVVAALRRAWPASSAGASPGTSR